jgi:uncharacterized protein (UPF0335 family)
VTLTDKPEIDDEDDDSFLDTSDERMKAAHNQRLRLFIERWERLQEEKEGIAEDQKEVMAEMKANGYDTKIVRHMIKLRRMETQTRQEWDALVETYRAELGLS